MSSFSSLVMAFGFRDDTPDGVLAAFSALERPSGHGAPFGPAPLLPEPVVETVKHWSPEAVVGWPIGMDPYGAEPWRHNWAPHLGGALSHEWPPTASLEWRGQWFFQCRSSFQCGPTAVLKALTWLGPFIRPRGERHALLGYVEHEYATRPWLLWLREGQLSLENLNVE